MSARTRQLASEMISLAEQRPNGWRQQMGKLYKQFEKAMHIDAKTWTALYAKTEQKRAAIKQAMRQGKDYERMNFEAARIRTTIQNAKFLEDVRACWDFDRDDPLLQEVWQQALPELKKRNFSGLSRPDPQLFKEIESVDTTPPELYQIDEIQQGIATGVSWLQQDVERVRAALVATNRYPDSPLAGIDPARELGHYFRSDPIPGVLNGMKLHFLQQDNVPENYDGEYEQEKADLQEQLVKELAEARDLFSKQNHFAMHGSDAWFTLENNRQRIGQLENLLRESGAEVPPNPYEQTESAGANE